MSACVEAQEYHRNKTSFSNHGRTYLEHASVGDGGLCGTGCRITSSFD